MGLPIFTKHGVLPPGDYPLTLEQLKESHLVTGQGTRSRHWDRKWRSFLVDNLQVLVEQLWKVNIDRIFVDGSFVEDKDHPNDIDGYFECSLLHFATRQLHRELNAVDPYKIWTWDPNDRRPDPNSAKKQLPMWHQYRVELYPHYAVGTGTNPSGIKDEFGNDQPFPAAFRKSRSCNRPKGIVQIIKSEIKTTP